MCRIKRVFGLGFVLLLCLVLNIGFVSGAYYKIGIDFESDEWIETEYNVEHDYDSGFITLDNFEGNFYSSFETGDFSKWYVVDGCARINDTIKKDSYSAECYYDNVTNGWIYALTDDVFDDNEFTWEFWHYALGERFNMMLHAPDNTRLVWFHFSDVGSERYTVTNGTWTVVCYVPKANWYHIVMNNFNFSDNSFDIYVYNSTEDLQGYLHYWFYNPGDSIQYVKFSSASTWPSQHIVDDVYLYRTSPYEGYIETEDLLYNYTGYVDKIMVEVDIPSNTNVEIKMSKDEGEYISLKNCTDGWNTISIEDNMTNCKVRAYLKSNNACNNVPTVFYLSLIGDISEMALYDAFFENILYGSGAIFGQLILLLLLNAVARRNKFGAVISMLVQFFLAFWILVNVPGDSDIMWFSVIYFLGVVFSGTSALGVW